MSAPRQATLFADGGARGNPGPAALGAVLIDGSGSILCEIGEYIGTATNNVAEWRALLAGLSAAVELGIEDLAVRLDSELVVRQIGGIYRVKHPDLIPLHERARALLRKFKTVDVQHIPRAKNKAADLLVNAALDAEASRRALDRT